MNMTGTCSDEAGSLLLDQQKVAWTTILYALIGFSLNTMLQPAGTVCGGPPSLGFMLKSSPIVCLIDTVYMCCKLLQYYWTSQSLKTAHVRLLRLRYQPWDDGNVDKTDVIGQVQNDQAVRIIVFCLSLPQMIRFYAFHGLAWSKSIASLYLASFVIVELLVVWPRGVVLRAVNDDNNNREKAIKSSGSLSLAYISIALAVAFLSFFGASAVRDMVEGPHGTLLRHLGLVTSASWSMALLFAYAMCIYDSAKWLDAIRPTLLLVLVLGVPWVYYALGPRITAAVASPVLAQTVSAALAIAWLVVGVKYASTVTGKIRSTAAEDPRMATHREYIEKVLAWYFMLLHIVTAVLYLCFSYDPSATSRPNWTRFLD
jgi:hypothetical protein